MAVLTGKSWIIPPRADGSLSMADIIPVLTNPGVVVNTPTSVTASVTVSRSGGTLYVVVTSNATAPSIAQIKAGQDETSVTAIKAANQVVTATGIKSFSLTSISSVLTLYAHFVHNAAGLDSAIVSSASFILSTTIPFTIPNLGSVFTQGVAATHDLRQYYNGVIPSGHIVSGLVLTPATGPLVSGITLVSANERLSYNGSTPIGSSNVGIDVTTVAQSSTALTDWNARIGAAGVLWAHAFPDNTNVNKWAQSTDGTSGINNLFIANQGVIPGYGCLRQVVPAGSPAIGSSMWARPMAPVSGDINQPGKQTSPATNWTTHWQSANIPLVINNIFAGTADNTPSLGFAKQLSNEIYVQFRVRFSANRFDSNVTFGKMLYFTCHFHDVTHEVVMHGKSNIVQSEPGCRAFSMYSNFGQWGAGFAASGSVNSPIISEPVGFPACEANPNGVGNCYLWQKNVWQTVLVRIKPGTRMIPNFTIADISNSVYDPYRNSELEVWCAQPGETNYTLVRRHTNLVFLFNGEPTTYNGGNPTPWGYGSLQFNPFTGGLGWQNNGSLFTHDFDQIICSTQPIACPQV